MCQLVLSAIAIAALGARAAAAPRCTLVKIKDRDVSIDVPVTAAIGAEAFCKSGVQRVAKQYALDHATCDPRDERETTFPVIATWGSGDRVERFELRTYCPPKPRR